MGRNGWERARVPQQLQRSRTCFVFGGLLHALLVAVLLQLLALLLVQQRHGVDRLIHALLCLVDHLLQKKPHVLLYRHRRALLIQHEGLAGRSGCSDVMCGMR